MARIQLSLLHNPLAPMTTIWRDGSYKEWSALDAYYAQEDPDWYATCAPDELEATLAKLQESKQHDGVGR